MRCAKNSRQDGGFTLIELSIVLVIIALIVGGVLVGRDLVVAAAIRAQIAQIDGYQSAVVTFYGKYEALPGDLPQAKATQFGFVSRGSLDGQGDGNGQLHGYVLNGAPFLGFVLTCGETGLFWRDLAQVALVEGGFTRATADDSACVSTISGTTLNRFIPQAKIGDGNYVYVWSGGWEPRNLLPENPTNYFGVSMVKDSNLNTSAGMTVRQAYEIDRKIDDGLPQAGLVLAMYANGRAYSPDDESVGDVWAAGGDASVTGGACSVNGNYSGGPVRAGSFTPIGVSASDRTCYDTGGSFYASATYSVGYNGGMGVNCALSFRFK